LCISVRVIIFLGHIIIRYFRLPSLFFEIIFLSAAKSFPDNFQKTEDWIELYNDSDVAVDISGWHLSDKENKPEKWEIPAGTM